MSWGFSCAHVGVHKANVSTTARAGTLEDNFMLQDTIGLCESRFFGHPREKLGVYKVASSGSGLQDVRSVTVELPWLSKRLHTLSPSRRPKEFANTSLAPRPDSRPKDLSHSGAIGGVQLIPAYG